MKNAIIFIIALAVSNLALAESHAQIHGKYAAPFGLEWGLSKEQVTAMGVELTPRLSVKGGYTTTTLPKNLSDGEIYDLLFKRGLGLVQVIVLTKSFTVDFYGLKGKKRYNQLKTIIVNKYGIPSQEVETTGRTRIYNDRDEFYRCLEHDRCGEWFSIWENEKGGTILLALRGRSGGTGHTALFRGHSGGTGHIALVYQSAAYVTATEERARVQKKREEERARAEEERARADEDAL